MPLPTWSTTGPNILDPAALETARWTLENEGVLILEHRHYYGGRSPTRLFFEEFDEYAAYLAKECKPGDSIWVWSYTRLCADTNYLVRGKIPDAQGRTPEGGAY